MVTVCPPMPIKLPVNPRAAMLAWSAIEELLIQSMSSGVTMIPPLIVKVPVIIEAGRFAARARTRNVVHRTVFGIVIVSSEAGYRTSRMPVTDLIVYRTRDVV